MFTVTVRLDDADGEVLGTLQHAAEYRSPEIEVNGEWYRVVGESVGSWHQTLYVVPRVE